MVTRSLPGCTTATQKAPRLPARDVTLETVVADPFGVVVTRGGRWAFVGLNGVRAVGVFRIGTSPLPSLVRRIPASPVGEALTPDGRYLLAADGRSGAEVISVRAAEAGSKDAVVGTLSAAGRSDVGAIEVAVSRDGRYAFVSDEDSGVISVFNLSRALADRFAPGYFVGTIPAQLDPVGLAFSPDGRWLYSTSEAEGAGSKNVGSLAVIDVAEAEKDPARSVVARTPAGCNPVRVTTSADGSVVWVTARASDALLAFSAGRLRTDPAHALLADVRVGELPVGLALARCGSMIIVADSDQLFVPGKSSSLAVVDVPDALAGRPALVGYLPAGRFPREMALEPDGRTLLVTNFISSQLEAVNVAGLP